jgi:hypothetical protein
MAVDIDSAISEVSVIESLELAVKKLDLNTNATGSTVQFDGAIVEGEIGGYGRFKSWAEGFERVDHSSAGRMSLRSTVHELDFGIRLEDVLDDSLALPVDKFWEGWQDGTGYLDGVDFGMDFGNW